MSLTVWSHFTFRIIIILVNSAILLAVLAYHSYRLCYLRKELKGSPIKIFKCISFKHLSFVVIIAALLPQLQQAITYSPQFLLSDAVCRFSLLFGLVCFATAKLALHLFVTMRSQVARGTTNIWYKIGLMMTLSDVLYIMYAVSPIPTAVSVQDGFMCKSTEVSLPLYIWFAMNDFVIGIYCLVAFIMPLRKYVWLEEQHHVSTSQLNAGSNTPVPIQPKYDLELRAITKRIMMYSAIALVSTILFTLISSVVPASGGALFAIDATVNALCVTLQFKSVPLCLRCKVFSRSANDLASHSSIPRIDLKRADAATPSGKKKMEMIIHPTTAEIETQRKPAPNKPTLKDNVSLSLSLVDNGDTGGVDLVDVIQL